MRLVLISDTHGMHDRLTVPAGDVLIHSGDYTRHVTEQYAQTFKFAEWLRAQPHKFKVLVAGNHDVIFEREPELARSLVKGIRYLQDDRLIIDGVLFYGSSYQPRFFDWAFNLERGEPLRRKWAQIPEKTQVLITHAPPYGILDQNDVDERIGDVDLLEAVARIKPKLHLFGHNHQAAGLQALDGTTFVNASMVNERLELVHQPIVFDL